METDGFRSVNFNTLRKQVLYGLKGKVFINAIYVTPDKELLERKVIKISNSESLIFNREIDVQRAIVQATQHGIMLAKIENNFPSGSVQLKLLDWGIKYGNDEVKIKTYTVRGKRRTGVWIKGRRGIFTSQKFSYKSDTYLRENISDEGLSREGKIQNSVWN